MNIYCAESMKERLERIETEKYRHTEVDAIAPIISLKKLYDDYDCLCNAWKFELKNELSGSSPLKRIFKKIIYKLNAWMIADVAAQQTKFNLAVLHIIDDVLRELSYYDKTMSSRNQYPLLLICLDPIEEKSNLQAMLAVFQYYTLHYNNNACMLFLNGEVKDYLYLEFLQRTVYEFQMHNVQFLITGNQSVAEEYMQKAFLQISFNEKNTTHRDNLNLLQFSTTERNWQDGEIIFDELDIQGIAKIICGIEMKHEEDTCY